MHAVYSKISRGCPRCVGGEGRLTLEKRLLVKRGAEFWLDSNNAATFHFALAVAIAPPDTGDNSRIAVESSRARSVRCNPCNPRSRARYTAQL